MASDTPAELPAHPPVRAAEPSPAREPGIGRLAFYIIFLGLFAVEICVLRDTSGRQSTFTDSPLWILFTTLEIYALAARLTNIGLHPAWSFFFLVPLGNLFVLVQAFLFPPGYKRHRKFDRAAKILCGFYVALFACIVLAVLTKAL